MTTLNFEQIQFRYRPFPIALATDVLPRDLYRELTRSFPEADRFVPLTQVGHKFTLSETHNPRQYHAFFRECAPWREMYTNLKSKAFIKQMLDLLAAHHVDLGKHYIGRSIRSTLDALVRAARRKKSRPSLTSRFEFSMLPAQGGYIEPHTDQPSKIITLVVAMVDDGAWPNGIGGGIEVNQPRNEKLSYNKLNDSLPFDEMETLATFPFEPNQAVIFVKTFNSWHSVRPMTSDDPKLMRKTLTINIETSS